MFDVFVGELVRNSISLFWVVFKKWEKSWAYTLFISNVTSLTIAYLMVYRSISFIFQKGIVSVTDLSDERPLKMTESKRSRAALRAAYVMVKKFSSILSIVSVCKWEKLSYLYIYMLRIQVDWEDFPGIIDPPLMSAIRTDISFVMCAPLRLQKGVLKIWPYYDRSCNRDSLYGAKWRANSASYMKGGGRVTLDVSSRHLTRVLLYESRRRRSYDTSLFSGQRYYRI